MVTGTGGGTGTLGMEQKCKCSGTGVAQAGAGKRIGGLKQIEVWVSVQGLCWFNKYQVIPFSTKAQFTHVSNC